MLLITFSQHPLFFFSPLSYWLFCCWWVFFFNLFLPSTLYFFPHIFLYFDRDGVFVFNFFFLSLCHTSEASTCLREHEAKFVLDRLPVHVSVFGRSKCVSQRNKPNLAAGSLSDFLSGCTPAILSFLLSAFAHSSQLSLSWRRHSGQSKWQLTSALIMFI